MLAFMAAAILGAGPLESVPTGFQLTFQGAFSADRGDAGAGEKTFELQYFVRHEGTQTSLCWTLDERGLGIGSWLSRFGRLVLDAEGRAVEGISPTLYYQRAEGTSVVPISLPVLAPSSPLQLGASWQERGLEYEVAASERLGNDDAWRIDVRSAIGRRRTLWRDTASPFLLATDDVVFVGQGEQHSLRYRLIQRQQLDEAVAGQLFAAFDELAKLREGLKFETPGTEFIWTPARLALVKSTLPNVLTKARPTPLAKLAQAAEQQGSREQDRRAAIGAMETKLVGRAAPRPRLAQVNGEELDWRSLEGKVILLHFWEYRDVPLEEPYGQVAYLDFIARKYASTDLKVWGIIEDERMASPDTRRAGIQSAKRLQSFMNLSYPLLADEGGAIRAFGDPRVTGAKLPLVVVIDRTGKVIHYHAGHYELNRDLGLEELDGIVKQALGTGE
ncbi:MAG: TlpA family protein disulfide reductase [Pirellulaceae bacterium]